VTSRWILRILIDATSDEDIYICRDERIFRICPPTGHKADQPDTLVDLFDAYRLTRERSAEIYFLFENADPSAAGKQNCAIVERIGEFS
jgi:hypothetical protein